MEKCHYKKNEIVVRLTHANVVSLGLSTNQFMLMINILCGSDLLSAFIMARFFT